MIPGDTTQLVKVIKEAMTGGVVLRQGKATAVNAATKTATIILGNNTIPDVKYIMAPTVNAEVWVLENGPDYLIIGSPGSSGGGGESLSATRVINGITWEVFIDIGDIGAANYKLSQDGVEMGRIQIAPDGTVRVFSAASMAGAGKGNFQVDNRLTVLGNLGPWTALPLAQGWGNYGAGWQTARYRKFGDRVEVEGLVGISGTWGFLIATLPTGFRPPQSHMFTMQRAPDGPTTRVDVASNGNISMVSPPNTSPGYLSLDGISFSIL